NRFHNHQSLNQPGLLSIQIEYLDRFEVADARLSAWCRAVERKPEVLACIGSPKGNHNTGVGSCCSVGCVVTPWTMQLHRRLITGEVRYHNVSAVRRGFERAVRNSPIPFARAWSGHHYRIHE